MNQCMRSQQHLQTSLSYLRFAFDKMVFLCFVLLSHLVVLW